MLIALCSPCAGYYVKKFFRGCLIIFRAIAHPDLVLFLVFTFYLTNNVVTVYIQSIYAPEMVPYFTRFPDFVLLQERNRPLELRQSVPHGVRLRPGTVQEESSAEQEGEQLRGEADEPDRKVPDGLLVD